MMRPLSYRQRLFVEHYLGESAGSAVDAARQAGYRWPEKLGPRLVEKPGVPAATNTRKTLGAVEFTMKNEPTLRQVSSGKEDERI